MKDSTGCREGTAALQREKTHHDQQNHRDQNGGKGPANASRRAFLGKMGSGATAVALAAGIPLGPMFEGKHGEAEASMVQYGSSRRARASYDYRNDTARAEDIDVGELPDNGDSQRFTDFSGNWSKCLRHDYLGIPNYTSYQSLLYALGTGRFSDFERILVGNPGGTNITATLNGPQGALAFDLEGRDSNATNFVGPAPSVASRGLRQLSTTGLRCCAT
jgi:hypothetical protein